MLFRQELMRGRLLFRVGVMVVVQVFGTMLHCSLARVVCSSHSVLFSFAFVRSLLAKDARAGERELNVCQAQQ